MSPACRQICKADLPGHRVNELVWIASIDLALQLCDVFHSRQAADDFIHGEPEPREGPAFELRHTNHVEERVQRIGRDHRSAVKRRCMRVDRFCRH